MARQLSLDLSIEIDKAADEPAFLVDVDGFEGPLDLLIELARRQKVDLHAISILALAEQYLAFVEESRRLRIELAADYLLMAAWLAYMKSRLLLPDVKAEDEPEAADLAVEFARRLRRLEVMRAAARRLEDRPRLGRDVFSRGDPDPTEVNLAVAWTASLYDILSAYARQRQRREAAHFAPPPRAVWTLKQARGLLERLIGHADWATIDSCLAGYPLSSEARRTARASTFSASLEMIREGQLEARQTGAFAPIWVRDAAFRAPGRGTSIASVPNG